MTESTEVAVIPQAPLIALGTLQADTPKALIHGATQIADTLAEIIRRKKLSNIIQGREYVRVEGWTVLGALLGVIAREESVVEHEDGTYLATVILVRMSDGVVISRASAECGMDESTWANRPKYARRSMALTRATGKAARLAFSWIMALAGFEPTPQEEMPDDNGKPHRVPYNPPADDFGERVPSGKHQGKKWSELANDYLAAITHGDKASPAFKAACQAEIDRRAKVFTEGISDNSAIPYEAEAGVRG